MKINSKHLLILSTLLLSVFFFLYCSPRTIEKKYADVHELMLTAIEDSVFPGGVLIFGTSENILFHEAFGNFTFDKNSPPVTKHSIFDLASITKVVGTTTAALLLVQKGKLNIDEKVVKYLPEFDNNNKEHVTVKNLLLHNSGLPAFKKYYDTYTSDTEIINDIMNLKLDNEPGEKYVYSDLGMITLQKIIERITGLQIDEFLRKNLFEKLEMKSTMYNPSDEFKKDCVPTEIDDYWRMKLIQGEVHDERAYMLNGVAGHAGLFSTAGDLSNFATMWMNSGNYNGINILNEDLIEQWTSKQSEQSDRALGWDTKSDEGYSSAGKYFSKNSFGHTGFTGTSIWIDKTQDIFAILLTNRVFPSRSNNKIREFRPILHDVVFESVYGN